MLAFISPRLCSSDRLRGYFCFSLTALLLPIPCLAAVNLPGFYYTLDNNQPGAVQCPINTYGPGLKKQRACVPCPTGFTTNGRVQQTMPHACGE